MTNAAYFGGAVFYTGRSFPQGRQVVNPHVREGEITLFK